MEWSRLIWDANGWALTTAILAALVAPIVLIAIRHEIRVRRIRLIEALERPFRGTTPKTGEAGKGFGPSIEFVKAKYAVDLDPPLNAENASDFRDLNLQNPDVERFLRSLHWWQVRSNWTLLLAALPYVALCAVGFFLVLGLGAAILFPSDCTLPEFLCLSEAGRSAVTPFMLVLAAAFLGAYAFSLRILEHFPIMLVHTQRRRSSWCIRLD